jgi:hypothetical protein
MPTDDRAKTPRTLMIADHIWEAFAAMAVEMGSDRDALVNQALYTFARLNGFLLPADLRRAQPPGPRAVPAPAPVAAPAAITGPAPMHDESPAVPARIPELAPQPVPSPPPSATLSGSDPTPQPHEDGPRTSFDLSRLSDAVRPAANGAAAAADRVLVLLADGRELERVTKDRFLIGRGKHCDLIINSGKVSREHAVITREGPSWFIEDLGSSNGTWFDKRRISRREIQDGDEYYICAEKVSCAFRPPRAQ